jgi:hypothetical protein
MVEVFTAGVPSDVQVCTVQAGALRTRRGGRPVGRERELCGPEQAQANEAFARTKGAPMAVESPGVRIREEDREDSDARVIARSRDELPRAEVAAGGAAEAVDGAPWALRRRGGVTSWRTEPEDPPSVRARPRGGAILDRNGL